MLATLVEELNAMRLNLQIQEKQRKGVEVDLLTFVPKNGDHYEVSGSLLGFLPISHPFSKGFHVPPNCVPQDKKSHMKENRAKTLGIHKLNPSRETILGQRATIAKICEEGKKLILVSSSP